MRDNCHACFRPVSLCLCAMIPSVANRTGVIVLQHPRERFHPFGSVRMLQAALQHARVERVPPSVGKNLRCPLTLPPHTGLLYPHPDARDLAGLEVDERPAHLLLLDGTWAHARRLYQENPWMQALPHFAISPKRKSRYLVRREPSDTCLSTLEATVEALQGLEPGLVGLDALLDVFERMNTDQVAQHASRDIVPRHRRAEIRPSRAIPNAVRDHVDDLVILHGETAELQLRAHRNLPEVFQWSAVRVGTGETFTAFVQPSLGRPTAAFLSRLGLADHLLDGFVTEAEAHRQFLHFLQPTDVLAAWTFATFKSAPRVAAPRSVSTDTAAVALKAAYCNARSGRAGGLDAILAREALTAEPVDVPGRAGELLGKLRAIALRLSVLARDESRISQERAPTPRG